MTIDDLLRADLSEYTDEELDEFLFQFVDRLRQFGRVIDDLMITRIVNQKCINRIMRDMRKWQTENPTA